MLLHFTFDQFDKIVFSKKEPQKSKKDGDFSPRKQFIHGAGKLISPHSEEANLMCIGQQHDIFLISLSNRSRTLQPCGIQTITTILPGQHGALYDKRHLAMHIPYKLRFLSTDRYLVHPSFYNKNNGFIIKPPDCYPCLCMQCVSNNVESTSAKTIRQMAFCRFE